MSIVKHKGDDIVINFGAVIELFLSKLWLILILSVLGSAVSFGSTYYFVDPTYTATVTLYMNNYSGGSSESITYADLNASTKLVDTYIAIIKSESILKSVIDKAGADCSASQLSSMISASSVSDTEVFKIKVVDTDPQEAADLANAIADITPAKVTEIIEGGSVKVVNRASVPTSRTGPSYKKAAMRGAGAGCILAVLIIIILELLDNRIQSEDDLSRFDLPVLGSIPEASTLKKNSGYRL